MNALVAERRTAASPARPGPCPVIETERLVLRPHRLEDADAIAASLGDFAVARMLTRVPVPYDRQDGLDWLNMVTSGLKPDWSFAITLDGAHVGVVSIELLHGLWHLGYWLNRFYWGRGLMSEAVDVALERFFRRMPAAEIATGAFTDNPASLRLLERRGCRIIGVKDVYSRGRNGMVTLVDMRLNQTDFAARHL
ncbi:acetyltransferase [Rhizobium sp. Root274]|uniref:GNAT family N-acetyltransferase n=1 Tax=unclassified Rhizobium TaxID=2613769 RepID=UPI0007143081|nr:MULTISPECIES: GNAT family N-acetyltransferase [unclassified Rhizobium]KQW27858.1 acetyltransferase [Rhizobium sp. Root1240]KRD28140.1 acetyltransferase [Rhizobium sp. Root274]